MKQQPHPRSSKSKNANFDLRLLNSVYESIGLVHPDNWKNISPQEVALIKTALIRADKLRTAAWDPGAAYMSGVLDMIATMRANTGKQIKRYTDPKNS